MFEPFQERNPHFFETISLSWFVMKSILKTYSFNCFLTKSLRIFFNGNLVFLRNLFSISPTWNWVFWTYMESNAAVRIHLEDLAVPNYLFLKDVFIFWWKISNCLVKYFASMWFFFIFRRLSVTECEKGHFYPFLHTVILSQQNILKEKLHVDPK